MATLPILPTLYLFFFLFLHISLYLQLSVNIYEEIPIVIMTTKRLQQVAMQIIQLRLQDSGFETPILLSIDGSPNNETKHLVELFNITAVYHNNTAEIGNLF